MSETVHSRSPAAGLVGFLYGVADVEAMPGAALVELLGEFGLAPAAARQQLARMRAAHQLASTREGRGSTYRVVGAFAAMVAARRADRGAVPAWDGAFHTLLHHVPETERAYRDRLRRTAVLVGYGPLQPGVLVAVGDRRARMAEVLAAAPPSARLRAGSLALDLDDARAAAREAWDLDTLAADLRAHLPALHAAVARGGSAPPASAATLRALSDTTTGVTVDLLRDPGLPVALRPPDWPGDDVRIALGALAARHGPPAAAYVHARIAAHTPDRRGA